MKRTIVPASKCSGTKPQGFAYAISRYNEIMDELTPSYRAREAVRRASGVYRPRNATATKETAKARLRRAGIVIPQVGRGI